MWLGSGCCDCSVTLVVVVGRVAVVVGGGGGGSMVLVVVIVVIRGGLFIQRQADQVFTKSQPPCLVNSLFSLILGKHSH